MRCDFCKYRNYDGHDEPCLHCVECGVPYVEDVPGELTDNFEPIEEG
jgi:hypothetical protein